MKLFVCLLHLPLLLLSNCASDYSSSQQINTPVSNISYKVKNLSSVTETINKNSLKRSDTLVVFDVDDTLLTASHFIGSDKWYEFQKNKEAKTPTGEIIKPEGAAKDYKQKFTTIGDSLQLGTMKMTEPQARNIFNSTNYDKLILTARDNVYRSTTLRELRRLGFKIDETSFGKSNDFYRFYMEDRNSRKATVQYSSGVMMLKGLHKGEALLRLLKLTGRTYKNVVFIDDKAKNINHMKEAMSEAGINYYGIEYTRVGKSISRKEMLKSAMGMKLLRKLKSEHF